jgi:hypothetical protein
MDKAIYAYPRDLAGDGLDVALDRIREIGFSTITLAASPHAGRFLRPKAQGGEPTLPDEGTVYFRARPERYGHIRPRVDPTVEAFDGLAELQRAAPDRGRAAWVVGCRNASLCRQHPEYVTRNALGDPSPNGLCPAHPAVRDYVVNLCSDLARGYDLAAVVLEAPGWLPYDHGDRQGPAEVPLDRRAKTLLALCFADATRRAARAADVDADRLQARAREMLERHVAADFEVPEALAAEWWLSDVESDPEWAAFLDWRCRLVADLVADVKAALPAGTDLRVMPSIAGPGDAGQIEGCDLGMLAAAADALEIPASQTSAGEVRLDPWDVRRRAGDHAALNFVLRPSHAGPGDGTETVAAVRTLNQVGLAGLAFYDYGHIRLANPGQVKAVLAVLPAS